VGSVGLTARLGTAAIAAAAAASSACAVETPDDVFEQPRYVDVVELFDQGIARTCSLNNGVCHNSNNYPDLHTVSTLVDTVGRPCNASTTDPVEVHDACEPAADHLVIPSAGIDARIVSAALEPDELLAEVRDLTRVTLTLEPVPAGLPIGATDTFVHRGSTVFAVGVHGARVESVDGATVVLDLTAVQYGDWTAKAFFDIRPYPPGPLALHVGDPNANGIEGAIEAPMPLIRAGDPDGSYVMRRLTDDTFGELMPRQCRTWDDRGNQALACWIAGLRVDAEGTVLNAYDPIDYDACLYDATGLGKCAPVGGEGFAAVEAIFVRSCAGTGCHVGEDEPASGLDLSPGRAYGALVGVPSTVVGDRLRVDAGSPDTSYLLCKLSADCASRRGSRMPLDNPPLGDADIVTITTWIADGAMP
jgi:hypothetical protein